MALIRYQSPDDSNFVVFETSRFRVDHGVFLLRAAPLRSRIAGKLEEQRGWNLQAMKLVQENRRLSDCLEWLDSLPDDGDEVVIPDLKHEPALDVVADRSIGDGDYARVLCPACEAELTTADVIVEPWEFEEEGITVRGRRSSCPQGHTIHVLTDEIDAADLELPDD